MNTCCSRLAIDGVSQAHTACSGCSSTLGYALRSNPNSTIAASPMLDKSLVNAYGEPVHTHSLSLHLPNPSGSQEDEFLPDRRQTALRSVAGGEPHALLYGSSLCAKYRLRRSRGKATRTTLPPICGSFHSHLLLQSLPTQQVPIRAERSEHIVLQPTNPPIMMWAAFRIGSTWRRRESWDSSR